MQEREVLSTLIGEIYDAALDPSLWVSVLGRVREFAGGYSAALLETNVVRGNGALLYSEGKIDPHYAQLYYEKYETFDPMMGRFSADIGVPTSNENFITYNELIATPLYQEWARPLKLVDFATTVLEKSATTSTLFGVFLHERSEAANDRMRKKLGLLAPHLRRALLVGQTVDRTAATAARFADTLDSLSAGMFLVDHKRGIVHANASGRAMLAAGDVLRTSGGRLTASDLKSDQALRTVLAAASIGEAAVGTAGIAQPLVARGGERYVAHVMPLTSGARRQTGKHYAAVAALFVHKVGLHLSSAPRALAKSYNLTPGELRVLLGIVQIGGVQETAEALGVGENTVKTHLQRVYAKTGAGRQAEIVKLAAEFSNPFVN